MDNILSNFIEKIRALAADAQAPHRIQFPGCDAFVVTKFGGGYEIITHEDVRQKQPFHAEAEHKLTTAESFVDYVRRFALPSTIVTLDPQSGQALAQIDYHEADGSPRWRKHRAFYEPLHTDQWRLLARQHELGFVTQEDFVHFVEAMEEAWLKPSAGDMLQIASNLEGATGVIFQRHVSPSLGQTKLRWEETSDVKAGTLEVPKSVTLRLPVIYGMQPVEVKCFVRVKIEKPLKLRLEIAMKASVLEQAYGAAFNIIDTGLAVDLERNLPRIPTFIGRIG